MDNTKCYPLPFPKVSISVISDFCEYQQLKFAILIFVCLPIKCNTRQYWSACYWATTMLLGVQCVLFPSHLVLFPLFPSVSGNKPTCREIPELLSVFILKWSTKIYIYIYMNVYCQCILGVHFPIILVGTCSSIIR